MPEPSLDTGPQTSTEKFIKLNMVGLMWSFIIVGALFFIIPDGVAGFLNSVGSALGDFEDAPMIGFRLWLSLGTAYMVLVSILAYMIQKDLRGNRNLLLVLAAGKATSSITCLHFYIFSADAFGYLLNFLVDGSIALMCIAFYRMLDPIKLESTGEEALAEGTKARTVLKSVLSVLVQEEEQTLDARLAEFLVRIDTRVPAALVPVLYIIEYGPYLWGPARCRFTRLSPQEQESYIEGFLKSSFYPRYMVLYPIRFLATLVFYDVEGNAVELGYELPELDRSNVGSF